MNSTDQYKEIFSKHQLRNTPIRKQVLAIFQEANQAISHHDIEVVLGKKSDRVTIYRTLQKFMEHGIIHQIEDGHQTFYALCDQCEIHDHTDNHVHFKCECCKAITCLHSTQKIQVSIPQGYTISQMKILIEGVCENCQS